MNSKSWNKGILVSMSVFANENEQRKMSIEKVPPAIKSKWYKERIEQNREIFIHWTTSYFNR